MSNSDEVMTTAIVAALYGGGNHEKARLMLKYFNCGSTGTGVMLTHVNRNQCGQQNQSVTQTIVNMSIS
ncbi:MAG: hypothetical protein U9N60_10240 [Thermodesulfobacteriota bacterium]|nr:hypothetical protein [Thermodesulfobacteriota bacterium]